MSKTVTLRLSEDVYERFRQAAMADNRPLSNLIETLALKQLHTQFGDTNDLLQAIQSFQPFPGKADSTAIIRKERERVNKRPAKRA